MKDFLSKVTLGVMIIERSPAKLNSLDIRHMFWWLYNAAANRKIATHPLHKSTPFHDDVIKWKHFPRYLPFVRGIHRWRWIPRTKAINAELWCFLCLNKRLSWQSWGWWFETPSHPLWRHCDAQQQHSRMRTIGIDYGFWGIVSNTPCVLCWKY